MMLNDAEECQLSGPIDELVPYTKEPAQAEVEKGEDHGG